MRSRPDSSGVAAAPATHKWVSLFGSLAELSVQGLLGGFLIFFSCYCCRQSRAVKHDCLWWCLFTDVHFHNDPSSSSVFSRCAVNYLPSQARILPLSPTVFRPLLRHSASCVVSTGAGLFSSVLNCAMTCDSFNIPLSPLTLRASWAKASSSRRENKVQQP